MEDLKLAIRITFFILKPILYMYIGLVAIGTSLSFIIIDAIANDTGPFLSVLEALVKMDTAAVEVTVQRILYAFSYYLENSALLRDIVLKFIGDIPFVEFFVEGVQNGWKVFHPNGYDLFRDVASACFVFVTTDVVFSLVGKAIVFQKPDGLYDQLCACIGNVVNGFGLSMLTVTISLLLFRDFSGWWYGIWGDNLLSNLAILGMLILLYLIIYLLKRLLLGKDEGMKLADTIFSKLVNTALMLCVLCYVAIIYFYLDRPAPTKSFAVMTVIAFLLLSFAIPYLLNLKYKYRKSAQ